MLTPEQIADGWKPHDGGPCPVAKYAPVMTIFRNGDVCSYSASGDIYWPHRNGHRYDIIAYKEQSNG